MDPDLKVSVGDRLAQSSKTITECVSRCSEEIIRAAEVLTGAIRAGRKILFFGNGGSATQADHLAGELVGKFLQSRRALPAVALSTSSAVLTSIANDLDFAEVFARQIAALGEQGDVAVGLSTSGNSPNVLRGLRAAKDRGLHTIALTGVSGGKAVECSDVCIKVPSTSVPRIQEAHLCIGHILCEEVERACT
jgi:D-sedoheptulose 7-phosphate isomerase